MPFYAYVISEDSPLNWRFVVAFATRDVADQWWRAIQTAAANNVVGWSTVNRVTPQLYTHKPTIKNIRESLENQKVAYHLRTQILFQALNDRDNRLVDIIPTQFTKDHISGKYFYIRSQRDPTLYWFVTSSGQVVLSRNDAPTPFVVELQDSLGFPTTTVLIGSDNVILSVPAFHEKGKIVTVGDDKRLFLSERREAFKFDALIDTIERVNSVQANVYHLYKNDVNRGEAWELV